MLVINDIHLGVQRSGGTTLQTQQALREKLREGFADLLKLDNHVVVNGDLFDAFTVDLIEVIVAHEIVADWLFQDKKRRITLIQGNHDANPRGSKISSFHLFCHFIKDQFRDQVDVVDSGLSMIGKNAWAIPHMANQELFALEVERASEMDGKGMYLMLHANVKNTFAEHSDHSLNLTDALLAGLMRSGWTLVIGHEHQGYELRGGRIIVVGNQLPSSVVDCLGNKKKHALLINEDGHRYIDTWKEEGSFAFIDWTDLDSVKDYEYEFIRVSGEATAAQASEVISAIARFRQRSRAFVVTNAVKIEGQVDADKMAADTVADIKGFDVLAAILAELDEREQKTVTDLLHSGD